MTADIERIWVYLTAEPLTALLATLLAYQLGEWLYRRSGYHSLCSPVLFAVLALIGLLYVTDTPYATYFESTQKQEMHYKSMR